MSETCVPGAEVVDGDPDAEREELFQKPLCTRRIGHQRRLGHFDLEKIRRDAVVRELRRNLLGKSGVKQIPSGQIDRHRDLLATVEPGTSLCQRTVEYVTRQRCDETRVFSQRNEIVGHDETLRWVLPAASASTPTNSPVLRLTFG